MVSMVSRYVLLTWRGMQNVRQKIADWDVWFHLSAGSMVPEKPIAGGPWGMDQPTPEILGELHKVDESF